MKPQISHRKISDVAEINPRLAESLPDDAIVSFLPMSAVIADQCDAVDNETRRFTEVSKGYTPFRNGDVLVAKITPCFENGKIAQARLTKPYGFGSTEFHVLRPKNGNLDARYLTHYLRQPWVRRLGERRMTGSAGQRRVPEHFLFELSLPLPSLAEQRRIAAILDQADALRAQRRAALAQLDALTQSLFLDMFGDPATNPKRWPIGKIGEMLSSASYGTSKKASESGDYPVLRMNNITRSGQMDFADLKYMDLAPNEHDKYLVKNGDVLFNRTNSAELVGKSAIFRDPMPMAYAGYLIRLRVNQHHDPDFLAGYLNSGYAKRVLRGMCKSIIGMANINATEIQAMKIPQPPLTIQKEFANRISATERLKAIHRDALTQLDALFASLQHRAFRGEL